MAYPSSYKAQLIAHDLADKIKARLNGTPSRVLESFDTDGFPLINIDDGSPAAGEQSALIKVSLAGGTGAPTITNPSFANQDIFGNQGEGFTPHVIQLVTELSATAGETLLSGANILKILGECVLHGCQVQWYMDTNGTAPTTADIVASKLKGTFDPNVYQPLVSGQ